MERLDMQTANLADRNFETLSKLFPNAITETVNDSGEVVRAVDADVLRQEISCAVVDGREERYQFTWPDKKRAIAIANNSINETLRLNREKSVDRDGTEGEINTENIYIEGDNLDALKILRETYLGKIKMIYIDPPYNTGSDAFIYDDNFAEDPNEYAYTSGQRDMDGNILFDMRFNNESNGRFHTDWLNMLYSRLHIAKDLLREDGLFFISIDEHEIDNCLKLLDDIWGRINRIGVIVIKSNPRGSMSIGEVANLHEYLVVYGKNSLESKIIGHKLSEDMESEYKYEDNKGKYRLLGLRMRGGFWRRSDRPNLYFPLYVNPEDFSVSLNKSANYTEEALPIQPSTMEDGTWRWSVDKIKTDHSMLVGRKVKRGEEEVWDIYQKDYYEREGGRRTKAKSIWDDAEINYQNGTTEIKNLFGAEVFDYSKPVYLISKIMEMVGFDEGDIILDFFSGSATTAQAVMQYNSENVEKKLKYILVQLPEECNEKSNAFKAGYRLICDIGEERIKKSAEKIKKDTDADIDYGYRVFKIDTSNMKDVYYRPKDTDQAQLDLFADNIKSDRTSEDLLFQVMLDLGVLLSSKIEEIVIAGKKVFSVADGFLIACFDKDVTEETVKAVAEKHPYYAVFRDNSMANDSVATNFDQIFDVVSPETERRIL